MVVVGAELRKLEAELKSKFDTFVRAQVVSFNNLYASKLEDYKKSINLMPEFILSKLDIVNNKKKELQTKLDNEKNSFIEDKLKDLFKKK